jgi:hypothetical protein
VPEGFVVADGHSHSLELDVAQSRDWVYEQVRVAKRKRKLGDDVPDDKEVLRKALKDAFERLKSKHLK